MLLKELLNNIEKLLPSSSAQEGDRIGLQVQSGRSEVSNLLVTMELTEEVVREAVLLGIDCIVAFHPLIYRPLAEISDDERVGRITTSLIQNSIAMISLHTTFDAFKEGTSKIIADRLSLEVIDFLIPDKNNADCGMGVICKSKTPLSEMELISRVSSELLAPVKYTSGSKSEGIETIAIVGGSGYSFIGSAISAKADAFITADVSYHSFHAARGKILLIDPGHYEMEQFVSLGIAKLLAECTEPDVKIHLSSCRTNPVSYFSGTDFEKTQIEYLNNVKIKWYN